MINDASVVIGGGNWGIKEADVLGYKLINDEYYARDIDFANSTAAGTYTDSTGVVRKSPYNLLPWSEDFSNVIWIKQEVTISSNVAIAPNGTQSADKITPSTLNTVHQIRMDSVVGASQCSFGVFAKADGYSTIEILDRISATDGAIFNLSSGTFTNKGGGIGKIENYGNGWYRCTVTANTTGIRIYVPSAASSAGDGTNGVLLWGAQLVEGTEALPYFPTTTRLNVPRIDYRNADGSLSTVGRLLLEPQRTNSIRNSSMVGAAAGTPGTLPTNWSISNLGTLTRTVIGTGTENGLPYIDYRIQGTASNTTIQFAPEPTTQIAATNGQTWASSYYLKSVAGTIPDQVLRISQLNSGGTNLATNTQSIIVDGTLKRYTYAFTMNQATTAFVFTCVQLTTTVGATYDFTIRIAAPQMELGAYATTWIPTTTAAVTRNADTASRAGVSSWIGQEEGTLFVDIELPQLVGNTGSTLISIGGPAAPRIYIVKELATTNVFQLGIQNAAGTYNFVNTSAITTSSIKFAIAYASGNNAFYVNGALISTASANANATSLSSITIGPNSVNVHQFKVNQVALFPTRLTNEQLSQITTL